MMNFLPAKLYQDELKIIFETYKKKIISLLPKARVEHIGSSAIPNAWSKGDLDILVCVHEVEFERTIEILKKLNFSEKLDTLRTHDLCMLESNDSKKDIAFQVVKEDSYFLNFLTFRNILSASPKLVEEYNQLKISCIGYKTDDYRKIKGLFIDKILLENKHINKS